MKNKVVCLVIILGRNQPASLDMLQSELITVQTRIQEPWHIKERALSNIILKYFRVHPLVFPGFSQKMGKQ